MRVIQINTDRETICEEEVISSRNEICNLCEFKDGEICTSCGCLLVVKTAHKESKCPEGKW